MVYRLAATLAGARHDPAATRAGQLRIGPGVLQLARRAQPLIADAALPALRRLAEQVGATAHLTVADSGEAVALAVVEPSWTQFHVAYRTGSRHPLDRGAAGRAIIVRAGSAGPGQRAGSRAAASSSRARTASPPRYVGVPGLEASVGVVALAPLDPDVAGPPWSPPPPPSPTPSS